MVKDKKIRIYKRVTGQDDYGEPIDKYVEVATTWAYYRQLSGQERFTALMVQAQEEALFVIGWRNDVTTDMLIEFRSKYYNISRIDDFEGNKTDIKLYAKFSGDTLPPIN